MTTFRRILSLASVTTLAASLAIASELTWDFSFSPSDVSLAPVGDYTLVTLPDGSNVRDAIGAPAIPAKFANILLPDGATDVSIAATGDLVLLASDITPYPVQRVAPKSKPQPAFTAPDPAAYASSSPWPAAVATYEGLHEMQGSTFVSVRVNPLVYVASEKALYYRPTVAVTVTYTEPATAPRSTRSVSQNALATEMVNALVVNPESADSPSAVRRRAEARAASTVDYLIITSSTLSNAFQNLATYRASAAGGAYKTLVVTTNAIASSYSGDDIQMKIRNCISNYVKSSGTTYVVLGGDDSVVPDRDCYGNVDNETYEWHMPTDLYYSDLTGTWKASGNTNFGVVAAKVDMSPDVIVGRIPVRTAAQLSGYLAKVQAFEADTSHTRNSIIMGGPAAWCRYYGSKRPSDDVTGDGHAGFRASNRTGYVSDSEMWNRRLFRDGIKPYWKSTESSITMKIACDSITSWDSSTCGDKALSSSNLKTWLNAGYTHFMFSGHGYPQGWGMETSGNYSTTQASSQTGLVAFVYTDACLTGAFDEDGIKSSGITVDYGTSDQYTYTSEPCLGEAFVRNSSGGALVHMGCARYGWGTPDASNGTNAEDSDGYYTNYTASASSDGGPSTVYAYKFYKRLYESSAVSSNRTLGAAFAMSKADMISSCSSDGCERWIQFGLNYLGDPAIALYPRAVADAAPEFSSSTASTNGYVGESIYFDFTDLLSAGSPAPTFTVSTSVSSSLYDWADGLLEFTPTASGTFQFTCTAANGVSPNATCTLTVTVTTPPPATPEVPATPPSAASTSFTATWTAVADAASYKLYVQQKVSASTSAKAARAAETVLEADFSDTTGWTLSGTGTYTGSGYYGQSSPSIKFDTTGDYVISPEFSSGTTLSFWAYGNGGSGSTFAISGLVNGSWTEIETVSIDQGGKTYEVSLPSGTTQLRFDFTKSVNCALDDVVVTGAADTWEDVPGSPFTVSGTSKEITGLSAGTEYRYAVTAVNSQGVEGSPSAYVTVETAEGDSAPSISVEQTSYAVTVGDPDVDFMVTVTGSPTPTVTHSCTEGAYYVFEDGEFLFTPNTVGTYHFVFTASNSEGSDTVTVTVTVSATAVTVPTLMVDDATDTTAYALWDECTGVTSYTLQLASDDQFTTGGGSGGGESVELVKEGFDNGTTLPTGWTVESGSISGTYTSGGNYGSSSPSLQFKSTVTLSTPTFSNPTNLSFWYKGQGSGLTSTLEIQQLLGGSWTNVDTLTITGTGTTLSYPLNPSATQVRFIFTKNSGNLAFDDVVIIGTSGSSGSSGTGSLIAEYTVADTEYTFTGLTPNTTYYARVKGNSDWSNVETFTTLAGADTAPVWSTIPPINVTVGEEIPAFYPANYVSGTPAPTITLSSTTAASGYTFANGTLSFTPASSGSYEFTFTADNGVGSPASATLTVTATGSAPVISGPQTSYTTTLGGADVEFTVTATGAPTPTLALSDTTATSGVTFDENDGSFSFTPYATGEFTFTFTATSLLGSDSVTVTVTVSAAPVTVPTLAVTNITDTSATASWTACDGVSSYTLQLSTNDFPSASSAARSRTPILAEDFSGFTGNGTSDISGSLNNYTTNSGWTGSKVYCNSGEAKVGASSGQAWLTTPALTVSGSVTVVWEARTYGTSDKYTLLLGISEDGTAFTDTTITLYDDMTGYTNTFEVAGTTAYVRWMGSGSSKARFYLDNVRVTTPESGGGDNPGGDDIQEFTVAGTTYTFTDLTPDTLYNARVKGDAGWSEAVDFVTLGASGTAPSIDPIADQTYTYGDNDGMFTLAVTASGTPAPGFSVTSTDALGLFDIDASGEFSFMPETVGTFHFTVTATNGVSPDATASFSVTVTGTAPAWSSIPVQSVTVGDDFELDLSPYFSGNPAPVLDVAENAHNGIVVDSTFACTPASAGTLTFTIVATNVLGTAETTLTLNATAAGTAPVWSTIPAQTVTVGQDCDLDLSAYVSGTAPITISLVPTEYDAVLVGTEFSFTPDAPGTFTFTFTAANGVGSAGATLTVTAIGTAPVVTVTPATYSYDVTVGDPYVEFTVTASGAPAPTLTATCTEGAYFVFENNAFLFDPDTAGTYHFVFTATNSEGSDTVTVTVEVSAAPVTIPTLTITDITDTTAIASWDACTGVSSYRLQLATDDQFTSGGFEELLSESFDNVKGNSSSAIASLDGVTQTTGWSCANAYSNTGVLRLGKSGTAGSLQTPSFEASGTLRVVWEGCYWTNDATVVHVGVSQNGGDFSTTNVTLTGSMDSYTNTFEITGTSSVVVKWSTENSAPRFFIDNIVVSGGSPAGSGDGSLVFDGQVTGTSHTFTGLSPYTVYYARVQGGSYWSPVVDFLTDQAAGSAPVWSAIPAQTVAANENVYLVLTDYVTGATSIAMTEDSSGKAIFDDEQFDFLFSSATAGTYTFTFLASNAFGTATATLTVTVTEPAPAERLELYFHDQSAAASTFTVLGTVSGASYTLFWTSDLRNGFTSESIGTASGDTMIVPFPTTTGNWFGYVRPGP